MPEPQEPEKPEAYVLDEQDQQELATLQRQMQAVQEQIAPLEARLERLFPRSTAEHFHLGMVGRGGRASARLNARKLGAMDASLAITKQLEPLYRERQRLTASIEALTTGQRKQQRAREAQQAQRRLEAQARVRQAKVGDFVLDSAFGVVKVVRKNRKSLTIQTPSGYCEARRFELINNVVRDQEQR